MMKLTTIIFCVLFVFFRFSFSQPNDQIEVTVHLRIDTSNTENKKIISLISNYFNSKPDSLYDNPYWSSKDKKEYKDYDLSTNSIYQFPSSLLLKIYRPTILTICKIDSTYEVIVALISTSKNNIQQNPWTILKYHVVNENGDLLLKNTLTFETKHWKSETIGNINFHFSQYHIFNKDEAERSASFCDSICSIFKLNESEFDFYITDNADEMGKLLNMEFYFAGYTEGKTFKANRLIFSGIGSEWFPHEFVHMLFRDYENIHRFIDEGTATWLGGLPGKSFNELIKENNSIQNFTFDDLLNFRSSSLDFYITGGILCRYIYEHYGLEGFKKLLAPIKTNEELYDNLKKDFKLDNNKLNEIIKEQIHNK